MTELADQERDVTPAEMIGSLQGLVRKTIGSSDPFQAEREHWWQELEGCEAKVRSFVESAEDPLLRALALATRANVFDDERLTEREVREDLKKLGLWGDEEVPPEEFSFSDADLLVQDLAEKKHLLFVHDTGPELFFDRLVIEQLQARFPQLEVTCVVRHRPILLHATHEDLEKSGILELPRVTAVDPGIDAIGLPLNECAREFRDRFDECDIVLGKGQAAFESLQDVEVSSYFAMRVKCSVMAKVQGVGVGELALTRC